jgi:hypothetical protein
MSEKTASLVQWLKSQYGSNPNRLAFEMLNLDQVPVLDQVEALRNVTSVVFEPLMKIVRNRINTRLHIAVEFDNFHDIPPMLICRDDMSFVEALQEIAKKVKQDDAESKFKQSILNARGIVPNNEIMRIGANITIYQVKNGHPPKMTPEVVESFTKNIPTREELLLINVNPNEVDVMLALMQ